MSDEPFAFLFLKYQRAPIKGFIAGQMKSENRRVFIEHLNMRVLRLNILIRRSGFSLSERIKELFEKSLDLGSAGSAARRLNEREEHRRVIRKAVAEIFPFEIIESPNPIVRRFLNSRRIRVSFWCFTLSSGLSLSRMAQSR